MKFSTWTIIRNKIRHMKGQDWLIVILIGMLILIAAIPSGSGSKIGKQDTKENSGEKNGKADGKAEDNEQEYAAQLETKLEDILEKMEGVGKVDVMITLKDEGETVLDKDVSSNSESYQENTVIFDSGNQNSPYVTKETAPQIEGVVVVAEGGKNAAVQSRIMDAVTALFGVEVHKVKVVPMQNVE